MKVRFSTGVLCLFLIMGSAHASFDPADNWTVTSLGTLGGPYSLALGMNESTQVVGYSYLFVSVNWRRAFLWDETFGMQDLGTTAKHSYAFGVNDAYPVQVVGYNETEGGATTSAFIWDVANGMQDLGTLGGTSAVAMDINDSGQVVGYSTDATGATRAFLWDATDGMQDLGTLGGLNAYGFSINASGQIVGRSQTSAQKKDEAFVWTSAGGMADLKALPGSDYSEALDINDSGLIVGMAATKTGEVHAVFWEGKKVYDLGTLGGVSSSARAVSNARLAVGNAETATGERHAAGWDLSGASPVLTDLNDLLAPGSGWLLEQAWDINSAGDVTGWGRLNGAMRPFLLQKQ